MFGLDSPSTNKKLWGCLKVAVKSLSFAEMISTGHFDLGITLFFSHTSMWKPCRISYEWGDPVISCGVSGFLVVHIPNAVGCTVLQYHILVS